MVIAFGEESRLLSNKSSMHDQGTYLSEKLISAGVQNMTTPHSLFRTLTVYLAGSYIKEYIKEVKMLMKWHALAISNIRFIRFGDDFHIRSFSRTQQNSFFQSDEVIKCDSFWLLPGPFYDMRNGRAIIRMVSLFQNVWSLFSSFFLKNCPILVPLRESLREGLDLPSLVDKIKPFSKIISDPIEPKGGFRVRVL